MKSKRFLCLLLVLLMVFSLTPSETRAETTVYFTAVNDQLLPDLSDETMPFWSGGRLYVPSTVITGTSSYALLLAEEISTRGLRDKLDLKKGVIGSERWGEKMRHRIANELGIEIFDIYGLTEIYGPGIGISCEAHHGMHVWEDFVYVEIVDPKTGEVLPDGEVGELVLTTINREAMPMLRYRTRDLTRILPGECPCGRHHKRLDRMKGRSDDMIILKGVNIFPIQIETVLLQFKELGSDYLITLETMESNDEMTIEVELSQLFTDDYARLQALTREITRQLKDEILVTPRVKLVPKGSLPKSEGKAVRVKDLRKTF